MYTQCSNCQTVFKLSAEVLRAAGGQVRCGRCGEVFSALARLSEDASSFETGESPLDLEKRAEQILEAVEVEDIPLPPLTTQAFAEGNIEIAHLKILDEADEPGRDPEASMEFTLPPGELDRIFVEAKTGALPPFPLGPLPIAPTTTASPTPPSPASTLPPPPARPTTVPSTAPPPAASAPATTAPPSPASTLPPPPARPTTVPSTAPPPAASAPAGPAPRAPTTTAAAPRAKPPAPRAAAAPPAPVPAAVEALAAEDEEEIPGLEIVRDNRNGGGVISEAVRRQVMSTLDVPEYDLGRRPFDKRSLIYWSLGGAALALLLAGQVVHRNREWLASHGPMGPLLRALYSTFGAPVAVPANLAAYELRQWGVTGDPAAGGTLKVRASILNTTAQLVPFPLLRVTLANRYGTRLGAREFEPSEYLGKPTARLLAPGERVDATLQILDPGKDAEGFEIDVCLRTTDRKTICANDVATPQGKS